MSTDKTDVLGEEEVIEESSEEDETLKQKSKSRFRRIKRR